MPFRRVPQKLKRLTMLSYAKSVCWTGAVVQQSAPIAVFGRTQTPGGCEEDTGRSGAAFQAWEASTREGGSSTWAAVWLCLGSATQAALPAGKSSSPSGLPLQR